MTSTTVLRTFSITALLAGVAGCSILGSRTASPPPPPAGVQDPLASERVPAVDPADPRPWAERVLASLTLDEKIGQMIMPVVLGDYTPEGSTAHDRIVRMIDSLGIGGLIVSVGTPADVALKLNDFQRHARIPLMMAADLETGAGFRFRGAVHSPTNIALGGATDFPSLMAVGATGSEALAYEMGRVTAVEARAIGVHVPFAPVLDVNSNPDNPIIGVRSFGEDPERVAALGSAFVRGIEENGAISTGKHFPGHGDTGTDSHIALPVIRTSRERLDEVELVPFREAIRQGMSGVMTAHIAVPALTGEETLPATLSPRVMTDLLRGDMDFEGLLFTDALDMAAIDAEFPRGEAAVRAIEAGADVLLMPPDVGAAVAAVREAIAAGRVTEARIDESVMRILEAKERLGLAHGGPVPADGVFQTVGIPAHVAVAQEIADRSLTLLKNERDALPIRGAAAETDVLSITYRRTNDLIAGRYFDPRLRTVFPRTTSQHVERATDAAVWEGLLERARRSDFVVVSFYVPAASAGSLAVSSDAAAFVERLALEGIPHAVVSFGSPYLLRELPSAQAYLVAWSGPEVSQRAAARALVGEIAVTGRTPTRIPPYFEIGDGLELDPNALGTVPGAVPSDSVRLPGPSLSSPDRFILGHPTAVSFVETDAARAGMSADGLAVVDSLMLAAVESGDLAGGTLAVGRADGLVRLRGYGWLDHDRERQATPATLYDLASLTKVVGTTSAIMLLEAEDRLSLDDPVVRHLPGWDRGDARKGAVTIRQLLLHEAGLPSFRAWYREMAGPAAYREAVYDEPLEADPGARTVYSDLGAITLGWVVEAVSGDPLDAFLAARVFGPLGMDDTLFRPGEAVRPRVAPTELDTLWRGEHVWGSVHDENAHAMGGVAGHAGLFSTAFDMAVFADMMLRGGVAPPCTPRAGGGVPCAHARADSLRLLPAEAVARYGARQSAASSRGLGWDTPEGRSSAGDYFTAAAFGHTGFTGTSIWIDPELGVYVVLLTNRVNPTRDNNAHVALRRAVHDAVARAISDRAVRRREG